MANCRDTPDKLARCSWNENDLEPSENDLNVIGTNSSSSPTSPNVHSSKVLRVRVEKEQHGRLPLLDGPFCPIRRSINFPTEQMEYGPSDRMSTLVGDSCRRSVSARSASPSRVSNAARNPTIGLNHGAMAKPRSARLRASSPRPSKARLTPNMKYGKKNASSSSRICRNSSFPSVYLDAARRHTARSAREPRFKGSSFRPSV